MASVFIKTGLKPNILNFLSQKQTKQLILKICTDCGL